MIYEAINQPLLLQVPKTAKRILDIGCGTGTLGKMIKEEIDCEVIGITYSETEANIAVTNLDKVVVRDLNNFFSDDLGKFDCVICSHILEHIYYPNELLQKLRTSLNTDGILLVALPNVLFWKQRWQFLTGHFKYQDAGLMDRTHFRFYDWETSHQLLEKEGYKILKSESEGAFPLPGIRKIFPKLGWSIDRTATKYFPGLFGLQFIFVCCILVDRELNRVLK
jgi:SAM-dependent methyltransferase